MISLDPVATIPLVVAAQSEQRLHELRLVCHVDVKLGLIRQDDRPSESVRSIVPAIRLQRCPGGQSAALPQGASIWEPSLDVVGSLAQLAPKAATAQDVGEHPDPYVYDGVHVYYRLYAIVAGVEILTAKLDGVEPNRVWEGPITIDGPGTYTGNWRSDDPDVPAIKVSAGVTHVIIDNTRVASKNDGVSVSQGAAVELRNSRGWGLHPMKQDAGHGSLVAAYRPLSTVVEHSYGESWLFDVYVNGDSIGNAEEVRVGFNRFRNAQNLGLERRDLCR